MKLIFCPDCHDIVALRQEMRECECGASFGQYLDSINARIGGKAIPIGFANRSFIEALTHRPSNGMGTTFTAFVIPEHVESIQDEGTGVSETRAIMRRHTEAMYQFFIEVTEKQRAGTAG